MFHNKETPTREVKAFHSQTMNPGVEQKRFEKHTPQKLVIRVGGSDLTGSLPGLLSPFSADNGPGVPLAFNVPAKLLQNLPDMCYVACEQFSYAEIIGGDNQLPINIQQEVINIQSPLFSSTNQYIPAWSGGGGEYSSIITSVPVNNSTYYTNTPATETVIGAALTTNVNGSVVGTALTITSTGGLLIQIGSTIYGAGIQYNTVIIAQVSGTPGGAGVYTLRDSQTAATVINAPVVGTTSLTRSIGTESEIFFVSWAQSVLQQQVGCYVVNKQMLNNQTIPFYLTDSGGLQMTTYYPSAGLTLNIQMTLVFYGLNDDERYSLVPMGIK